MATIDYQVMTGSQGKSLLAKHGIKMPWEEGHEDQLAKRTPDAAKEIAEITAREDRALEDAQVAKVRKAIGKPEGEVKP